MLFTLFPNPKRSGWLIGALFLLNTFSLRFLEVELDDYLMYCFCFLISFWLKSKFPERNFHKIFALSVVIAYVSYHIIPNFSEYISPANARNPFTENARNPLSIFMILPTLYLLFKNRKWGWLGFMILFYLVLMSGKMLSNPIPILAFALYLDFLTDREFKYRRSDLTFFFIIFLIWHLAIPIQEVRNNNLAFEKYCNAEEKVCYNNETGSYHYGHYFAWLGYKSANPSNYGMFCCQGAECI